jgi:proteasome lid subunit RPN8/RPN11
VRGSGKKGSSFQFAIAKFQFRRSILIRLFPTVENVGNWKLKIAHYSVYPTYMLKVGKKEYAALRRHGEETYPHECCGVLLGRMDGHERLVTSVVGCGNTRTDSPHNRYHIDPQELVRVQREGRERGEDIVGFYHSHPDHPARWSPTDLAEAHWIGCSYVITSVKKGKADATNSFELLGSDENDKKFADEEVEIM